MMARLTNKATAVCSLFGEHKNAFRHSKQGTFSRKIYWQVEGSARSTLSSSLWIKSSWILLKLAISHYSGGSRGVQVVRSNPLHGEFSQNQEKLINNQVK